MTTIGKKLRISISMFLLLTVLSLHVKAQDGWDELAKTPPMGWNSWNTFRLDINEDVVKGIADVFVEKGFKEAGYEFIVIDDGWQIRRDEEGNIIADDNKFPSGIKALADYIHSKGLKLGIYSDAGSKTCGEFPGSLGHEYQDARQYAAWGIDYLKYDWCFTGNMSAPDSYRLMRNALETAGRPLVFSICEWGSQQPWEWGEGIGHMWRTTYDIRPCWDCGQKAISNGMEIENFIGFTKILDMQVGLESYAGPGHWNDPEMLEVGNGNLTIDENKAHFSLWCILSAPLMLGNDIRKLSPEIHEILTNREVIAVDQDPLGKQGVKVKDSGDLEVWVKQLSDGSRSVVLFNRSGATAKMTVTWNEMGYPEHLKANVRDLWKKKDMGSFSKEYSDDVPSHGVVMVRVEPN